MAAIDGIFGPIFFDFVRTGLEYVPPSRQPDLVRRLLEITLQPGGRLIIGSYNEEKDGLHQGQSVEDQLGSWGFSVAGRFETPSLPRRAPALQGSMA